MVAFLDSSVLWSDAAIGSGRKTTFRAGTIWNLDFSFYVLNINPDFPILLTVGDQPIQLAQQWLRSCSSSLGKENSQDHEFDAPDKCKASVYYRTQTVPSFRSVFLLGKVLGFEEIFIGFPVCIAIG